MIQKLTNVWGYVTEYEYDFYDDYILEQQELEDFAQDGHFENMEFEDWS